jgi:hypothetical protein
MLPCGCVELCSGGTASSSECAGSTGTAPPPAVTGGAPPSAVMHVPSLSELRLQRLLYATWLPPVDMQVTRNSQVVLNHAGAHVPVSDGS